MHRKPVSPTHAYSPRSLRSRREKGSAQPSLAGGGLPQGSGAGEVLRHLKGSPPLSAGALVRVLLLLARRGHCVVALRHLHVTHAASVAEGLGAVRARPPHGSRLRGKAHGTARLVFKPCIQHRWVQLLQYDGTCIALAMSYMQHRQYEYKA